ncbi:DUF6188 family protein [Nonomuraea sp. 3N208]|uniref:DUF6188 family protein n=1 Tax=Nonomuraea sp. 3N208 TaxID=3457421 RepID=UPI003FD4B459
MESLVPVEHEDRWVLGLRGLAVTRIGVDHRLSLALGPDVEVVVETAAALSRGPMRGPGVEIVQLLPERQDVAGALALFGAQVLSAVAFKTGSLRLVFSNALHVNCRADADFEAWQVAGPGDWRFVSLPGGDLGVWRGPVQTGRDHNADHDHFPMPSHSKSCDTASTTKPQV